MIPYSDIFSAESIENTDRQKRITNLQNPDNVKNNPTVYDELVLLASAIRPSPNNQILQIHRNIENLH